ncbi:MAG: NADH-quinone oxidoreductase subunit C [Nitrospinales bacterium]
MESSTVIIDKVKSKFGDMVLNHHNFRNDQTLLVKKECIVELAKFLREEPSLQFNFLMDLSGVDYLKKNKPHRYEVVYHFFSLKHNHRVRIKVPVTKDDCVVDSLAPQWRTANWLEREVWDMFGIKFNGHPNLKRILLYEEFKGHPLRKDYPVNKRQPLIGPVN